MTSMLNITLPGPVVQAALLDEAPRPRPAAAGPAPAVPAPAALEAERQRLAQTRQALEQGLARLQQLQVTVLRETEQQVVDLALTIARKVLMQEVDAGRYQIQPILKEALGRIPAGQAAVVHLNPADFARAGLDSAGSGEYGAAQFVPDPAVSPAQCVIETPHGLVASILEEHLNEIAKHLKDADASC